jgi:hypothetical protein
MDIIWWFLAVVMAFAFAYTIQFTSATLSMGREISDTDSPTGFQDAITPPWQSNLALIVYLGCVVVVGVIWWQIGWLSALGGAAVIFFGSSVAKLALPKPTGDHYKLLIMNSMISRYADYVRDGDALRADAMKSLLFKVGIDPDA